MTHKSTFAHTHRDLTPKEIVRLPIDMSCCYFLRPWNHSVTITTVEEWADQIGFFAYGSENTTIEEDARLAKDEANKLITFVEEWM